MDFPLDPLQDNLDEGDETATLTLIAPSGYFVANGSATITIADFVPTVTIMAIDPLATEPIGTASATDTGAFVVTRDGNFTIPLTVTFVSPVGGGATAGADYVALPGLVTIDAGATSSATIVVTPKSDTETEGTESVLLALADGDGYQFVNAGPAEVDIADAPLGSVSGVKFEDLNGNGSVTRATGAWPGGRSSWTKARPERLPP